MRIAIVSGKSEGPSKLNAFDNALLEAGIGDVNLIKVSSMLEGNTQIAKLSYFKPGSMVNCVLSNIESDIKGDKITAVVAVAIGDNLGCVVEKTGLNVDKEKIINDCELMVKYMMIKRNEKIKDLIIEESSTTVDNIASVIAAVVYL
ncbi:MAG: arginine decarboxylase, pyruvoyl-dependent [Methanobrevibacter sp.]|jgi:arginine decarboxylase|nr:arginine decarboxylase, pyruvoyl-dependent [Methanobrevibacter sp.]